MQVVGEEEQLLASSLFLYAMQRENIPKFLKTINMGQTMQEKNELEQQN